MKTTLATLSVGVASVALFSACSHLGGQQDAAKPVALAAAKPATMAGSCADISSKFKYEKLRITSSVPVAVGAVAMSGAPTAPKTAYDALAHCLVKGVMDERKGVDGKDYAIGFEMRLPTQWNGRFYHQVNGGLDGVV